MQRLQKRTVWGDISAICISGSVSQTTWQHEQQSHPSARAGLEALSHHTSWMASETRAHHPFQRHRAAGDTLNSSQPPMDLETLLTWIWPDQKTLKSLQNAALHHCHMALFILGEQALFKFWVRLLSVHIIYIQVSFIKELGKRGENRLFTLLCPLTGRSVKATMQNKSVYMVSKIVLISCFRRSEGLRYAVLASI